MYVYALRTYLLDGRKRLELSVAWHQYSRLFGKLSKLVIPVSRNELKSFGFYQRCWISVWYRRNHGCSKAKYALLYFHYFCSLHCVLLRRLFKSWAGTTQAKEKNNHSWKRCWGQFAVEWRRQGYHQQRSWWVSLILARVYNMLQSRITTIRINTCFNFACCVDSLSCIYQITNKHVSPFLFVLCRRNVWTEG